MNLTVYTLHQLAFFGGVSLAVMGVLFLQEARYWRFSASSIALGMAGIWYGWSTGVNLT